MGSCTVQSGMNSSPRLLWRNIKGFSPSPARGHTVCVEGAGESHLQGVTQCVWDGGRVSPARGHTGHTACVWKRRASLSTDGQRRVKSVLTCPSLPSYGIRGELCAERRIYGRDTSLPPVMLLEGLHSLHRGAHSCRRVLHSVYE